jgi:hypothetical protein
MRTATSKGRLQRDERLAAASDQAHPRARSGTGDRNRGADAGSGAGDQYVLIVERFVRHDR